MKWLTIGYIKEHSRIDFDCEDGLLELYAYGAEEAILAILNRTYDNLIDTYDEVPAPIIQASLLVVDASYQQRTPASAQNLSVVPYNIDFMISDYALLAGTPLVNEKNYLLRKLSDQQQNLYFFKDDDRTDETFINLDDRIKALAAKFETVTTPTILMLTYLREGVKAITDDVNTYLKS